MLNIICIKNHFLRLIIMLFILELLELFEPFTNSTFLCLKDGGESALSSIALLGYVVELVRVGLLVPMAETLLG